MAGLSLNELIRKRREYSKTFASPDHVPVIDLKLPRSITSLHQIEISSKCNLRCVYCPSPNLQRPKVFMERAVFVRCMEWVAHLHSRGTQIEVNLAGIGESTIHPDFVEYLKIAREMVGDDICISMATNGLTMTEELAKAMAPHRPLVFVSLHRPEKAKPAIDILRRHGMYVDKSDHPATNAMDWAGQVDWEPSQAYTLSCQWIRHGFAMAMADGRITSCCMDASGVGVIGHVDDPVPSVKTKPYDLCASCHQVINIRGFKQK